MKALFFLPTLLSFLFLGKVQTSSDVFFQGKVTDKSGEPLIGASLLFFNATTHLAATTDVDGQYKIKLLPATYTMSVAYVGYETKEIKDIVVKETGDNVLDVVLEQGKVLEDVVVSAYKIPVIKADVLTTGSASGSYTIAHDMAPSVREAPSEKMAAMVLRSKDVSMGKSKAGAKPSLKKSAKGAGSGAYIDKRAFLASPSAASMDGDGSARIKTSPPIDDIAPIVTEKKEEKKESKKSKKELESERISSYKPLIESALDIQAGRITASENSDFKHWDFWKDEKKNTDLATNKAHWKWTMDGRVSVLLTNKSGFPLANFSVHLENESGRTIWKTTTDNLGRAELWTNMFDEKIEKTKIVVENKGEKTYVSPNKNDAKAITIVLDLPCATSVKADVMFVVDATSSMGDEIQHLQMDMQNVIERVKKANPSAALRLSSVFYRDKGDEYLTRESDFSEDVNRNLDFIKAQSAGGGGDYPEAVETALEKALSMSWDEKATTKILFLLLDAPPHYDVETLAKMKNLTAAFAAKGIKIVPISASGIQKDTEYLMRFMALATNGTYTYLTNDSGIGGDHIDATVSDVSVEFLNNLLVRLINQNMTLLNCQNNDEQNLQRIENQQDNQNTQAIKLDAKLYPTVANTEINLEISEAIDEAFIYSNEGRLLKKLGKFNKGKHRIELGNMASGMYFLQIVKQGVSFGQKFIVVNDL